jgi:dihydrolipoamide dehydrogenase
MKKYDIIIIGGGPAGYKAAEKLANLKKSVCLIEYKESHIGGTCLNEGCIPAKSLLESAGIYKKINESNNFGINSSVEPVNMTQVREAADNNIKQLKAGLLSLLKSKDIDILFGKAAFIDNNTIEIILESGGRQELQAANFLIATGSISKELPQIETDGTYISNSTQIMQTGLSAKNILIIGGGYIGCEFASFFNKFKAKVTIIEICSQLMPGEDSEISRTLAREFKKQGIRILTDHKVTNTKSSPSGVEVTIEALNTGKTEILNFDKVLISTGRIPNTSELNLDKIGVQTENGFIAVDKNMKTSLDNIYAAGDVINTPMLAHVAYREGIIAAESIAGLNKTSIDYNAIPRIVFSSPQIGCIGLTEEQAKENGFNILVKKKFFKANAKATIMNQTAGFAKLIFNKETTTILGAGIIGSQASELIHILSFAVERKHTLNDMSSTIYSHPTLSEIIADMLT